MNACYWCAFPFCMLECNLSITKPTNFILFIFREYRLFLMPWYKTYNQTIIIVYRIYFFFSNRYHFFKLFSSIFYPMIPSNEIFAWKKYSISIFNAKYKKVKSISKVHCPWQPTWWNVNEEDERNCLVDRPSRVRLETIPKKDDSSITSFLCLRNDFLFFFM